MALTAPSYVLKAYARDADTGPRTEALALDLLGAEH